jgi:hypothetical protein
MKEFLEKLKIALNELEEEHGEMFLFALFQRDNPLDLWDLVVAAPWLRFEDLDSLQIVCSSVQDSLRGKEILKLSHVVILDQDDPTVVYLRENYDVPNGRPEEVIGCEELSERLDFIIKRAYLLRCRKIENPSAIRE